MFEGLPARFDSIEALLALETALEASTKVPNSKGKGKCSTYTVFDTTHTLTGWKFNEFDYANEKIHLPVRARGFFMEKGPTGPRIVVRGYDKFFSVGEVSTTHKQWLRTHTQAPYELTLKENGCIIFVSGLADGSIVVCSKHSTGYRNDIERNHALAGQQALVAQLTRMGKNARDLALELYALNVTAVAEFCDDRFEEHVLEYSEPTAQGLYLHGLNFNTITFQTYPMARVGAFARRWGFIETDFIEKTTFEDLDGFLTECAVTGAYNGRDIEGFVIRSRAMEADFFWKFKFEEPYLMYREWRELTKRYLANTAGDFSRLIRKTSKHQSVCFRYLEYIIPELERDPGLKDRFTTGHGIIELRNRFLAHTGQTGIELASLGETEFNLATALQGLSLEHRHEKSATVKYVLIPVSTIGCGKTTTAVTLTSLMPWAHIQNDNLGSPAAPKLVKGALALLQTHDVVIVDRNNHMFRERTQLFEDFERFSPAFFPTESVQFRFVALDFVPSGNPSAAWSTTVARVTARGDNHQSIQLSVNGEAKVHTIMQGFVDRFQPLRTDRLPDKLFDMVIPMSVGDESSKANAVRVLEAMRAACPELVPKLPSAAAVVKAFATAKAYVPVVRKVVKDASKQGGRDAAKVTKPSRPPRVQYYALAVSKEVTQAVERAVGRETGIYAELKRTNRVQSLFHVTLCHAAQASSGPTKALFEGYQHRFEPAVTKFMAENPTRRFSHNFKFPVGLTAEIVLKRVVFDDRLVCVEVELGKGRDANGEEFSLECANTRAHITIGTKNSSVKPVESNAVLEGGDGIYLVELAPTTLVCEVVASF